MIQIIKLNIICSFANYQKGKQSVMTNVHTLLRAQSRKLKETNLFEELRSIPFNPNVTLLGKLGSIIRITFASLITTIIFLSCLQYPYVPRPLVVFLSLSSQTMIQCNLYHTACTSDNHDWSMGINNIIYAFHA